MGERMSGGLVPGRRHAHPGSAASGSRDHDTTLLETALAAAVRVHDLDPEAEQRARTAFRAARDAGAHRARTRRRDDWRLPAARRAGRSVRMTLGVVFASLTLGGVAVAAIGSAVSSSHGAGAGQRTSHPPAVAPARPGDATSSASSGGHGPVYGRNPAKNTEAHCHAYEKVKDHGNALGATAWQQLIAAAGGKDRVAAYCSDQLARAAATSGKSGNTGKSGASGHSKGTSASRNSSSSTGSASRKGRTSGGKGGVKHK
ncbi:hypothetical protein ACWEN3_33590 [Streptomyces sp. NPDC004561]